MVRSLLHMQCTRVRQDRRWAHHAMCQCTPLGDTDAPQGLQTVLGRPLALPRAIIASLYTCMCPAGVLAGTHAFSAATWLSAALPSSARVVKGFNNLSAYTLIHGDPLTEHMKSVAAADDSEAAGAVAEFGRALGVEVITGLGGMHSQHPVMTWSPLQVTTCVEGFVEQ